MQEHKRILAGIIQSYDDAVVRAYCWGRFQILRQRFLEEIGQYLPESGEVLDVGSGIGMFAMYFAHLRPELALRGFDMNPARVELSRRAARRLALDNVRFEVGRAEEYAPASPGACQAIYVIDVIHHMLPATVPGLVEAFHRSLAPGGLLLVKEVDRHPAYKRLFTHALDLLMDPRHPPRYWAAAELRALLERTGFRVRQHALIDYLPYPHVLYVCEKRSR